VLTHRPVTTLSTSQRARSAPSRGWPPYLQERRGPQALTVGLAQHPARNWLAAKGNHDAPGARLPSFGPSAHVGAVAHPPHSRQHGAARRNVSGSARPAGPGHPSGARILKPCVLTVKIARCACVAARSLRASGPLRRRDSGAPIGGMARSEHPRPVAPKFRPFRKLFIPRVPWRQIHNFVFRQMAMINTQHYRNVRCGSAEQIPAFLIALPGNPRYPYLLRFVITLLLGV